MDYYIRNTYFVQEFVKFDFKNKINKMTEQQILKKIDAWDEQDKIQAIVDFVEGLPVEQRTTQVLSELARAYNNLYWQGQTE